VPVATVLIDAAMDVDKELIGTKDVILDRPGPIIELIELKPGCTFSELRLRLMIVLILLAPGRPATVLRPSRVTRLTELRPGK
jgi:hypothetical protein